MSVPIEQELKSSYLAYSMSVIVGRAIPSLEDGLKPVQRRILYAMARAGLTPDKPFRKCARIVGDTLGNFHPHGDAPVYEALVRLAQPFATRYPLIQGQGNFGSIDGDAPAAMRYTEARLTPIAMELLKELDSGNVKYVPNFDGSSTEPEHLPARFPALLVNGSAGIAVGMATWIPPHNLKEICQAAAALLDRDLSPDELLEIVKGPDFPTGGVVFKSGLAEAYARGKGQITIQGKLHFDGKAIVITEIPYLTNKAQLVAELSKAADGQLAGIAEIRDESNKDGIAIVLELAKGANPELLKRQILSKFLRTKQSMIMLCLVGGVPKILPLKDALKAWLEHRARAVRARTEHELRLAEGRLSIVQGLLKAIEHIDAVLLTIKTANSVDGAIAALSRKFELSKEQAKAVVEMKLSRLVALETQKLDQESRELEAKIAQLRQLLASERAIAEVIKKELESISALDNGRKTQIVEGSAEKFEPEQLIQEQDLAIVLTDGYIKAMPVESWKTQKRGGKGLAASSKAIKRLVHAHSKDWLLLLTNKGNLHWLKAWQIPIAERTAKETPIKAMLRFKDDESVVACTATRDFSGNLFIFTQRGFVKRVALAEFENPRKGGIRAICLDQDKVVGALVTAGNDDVLLISANGFAIRFNEQEVRQMGRAARGVIGIRLKQGDKVVAAVKVEDGKDLLTVTEKGFVKRTAFSEYRRTARAGFGLLCLRKTEKNGAVIGAACVGNGDDIMVASKAGKAIRFSAQAIARHGRVTQGVKSIELEEGDELTGLAVV